MSEDKDSKWKHRAKKGLVWDAAKTLVLAPVLASFTPAVSAVVSQEPAPLVEPPRAPNSSRKKDTLSADGVPPQLNLSERLKQQGIVIAESPLGLTR